MKRTALLCTIVGLVALLSAAVRSSAQVAAGTNLPPQKPIIVGHPQSIELLAGESFSFVVMAVGNPAPAFQWRFHGREIPGATCDQYHLPNLDPSHTGDYTVVVTNAAGAVTSLVARLTVRVQAPEFVAQPVDTETYVGAILYLVGTVRSGPRATYRWYRNGTPLAGATNEFYVVNQATVADAGLYSLVASNSLGVVTSRVARADVATIQFINQPGSQFVTSGQSFELFANAAGVLPLTLRWYFNGTNLVASNALSYRRTNATTNDAGTYFVVASNRLGMITSAVAVVGVDRMPPLIVQQPQSQSVPAEQHAHLSVEAVGNPLFGFPFFHFQWRKNGVPIPSARSYIFTPLATPAAAGAYDVVIRNPDGMVTSAVAVLTVELFPPRFQTEPSDLVVPIGQSAYLSVSVHAAPAAHLQWYRNGIALRGRTEPNLPIDVAALRHTGNYFVVASNVTGVITSRVARLVVHEVPPYFTSHPQDRSVLAGENFTLDAYAGGTPPLHYQWYREGNPVLGLDQPFLNLFAVTVEDSGRYWVVASNPAGAVTSRVATVAVAVRAPRLVRQPTSLTALWGTSVHLESLATGGPAPEYQWFFDGMPIPQARNASLSLSPLVPSHAGNYTVVARNSVGAVTSAVAQVRVTTQAPAFIVQPRSVTVELGMSLTLSGQASGAPAPVYQWWFNDIPVPGGDTPSLRIFSAQLTDAGRYYLVARNDFGVATSVLAVVTVPARAPVFTVSPSSQSVLWGSTVSFTATASGATTTTLQWLFNNIRLAGETSPILNLFDVTSEHAGAYRVVAANAVGATTSAVAVLTVRREAPVFVTDPSNASLLWGESLRLTAAAIGGPPPTLQWLFNGTPIQDATTTGLLIPAATPTHSGRYAVVASNAVGVVTSAVAVVTVETEAPYFSFEPSDTTVLWGENVHLYAHAIGGPPPTLQWYFNGARIPRATNDDLDLGTAIPTQSGHYMAVASNQVGVTTSAVAVVTVRAEAPYFTTEPIDTIARQDDSFSIYASARGGPLPTLQWWFNGRPIRGATNEFFNFSNIEPTNAGSYFVVASNIAGVVTSAVAVVTVQAFAPFFVAPPRDTTVLAGEVAGFQGGASGAPPPQYQWLFNGAPIRRENLPWLYLSDVGLTQAGNYQLVASNILGVITSRVAVLRVNTQAPVFLEHPTRQTVPWGTFVGFSALATGGPRPTYQWLFNGRPLVGQIDSRLALQGVTPANAGNYRVVASNAFGVVTSAVAVLTVTAQAPLFFRQPESQTVLWDADARFDVVASGAPEPTLHWLRNDQPVVGEGLGQVSSPFLFLPRVTPADAGSYRVVASNAVGVVTSRVAVLTVTTQAPVITRQPADQSLLWGNDLHLWAAASGGPLPQFQWFFNGNPLTEPTPGGVASIYNFLSVHPTNAGNYFVIASNQVGVATSRVAVVTVLSRPPRFEVEPNDQTVLWGDPAYFWSSAIAGPPATYQWYFNQTLLPGETNSSLDLRTTHTNDAGLYYVVAMNPFGSVTSRVATLTIDVLAPEFQTEPFDITGFWGGTVGFEAVARGGPPPTYQWYFNNRPIPSATNQNLPLLEITGEDDGLYFAVAHNDFGSVTSYVARLEVVTEAPQFVFVSPGEIVVEGADVRLFASASGAPEPVVSLRFNGAPLALPYAEDGGFLLPEVTTNDAGNYTFVASNFVGSVVSSVMTLDVRPGGPLDRWTRRNPRPQGQNLLAITHGNDQFVATGERGAVMTSVDGFNWSAHRLRADADVTGITYGNGLFVSVTRAGNILTSSNGIQWLPRVLSPELALESVVFGNGRFVAVGGPDANRSLVSFDGLEWQPGRAVWITRFKGVAYGQGRFVGLLGSSPWILTSSNGLDWVSTESIIGAEPENATFAAGQFVVVGGNGSIFTSPDGLSWTHRDSGVTRRLIDVTYGNGRWVAVGVRGIIRSSEDGVTWRAETSGTPDRLEGVTFAEGLFVAVGENGTTLVSTNGVAWSRRNVGTTRDLDGMTVGRDGQIVTVGKFGTILTTLDGFHLTERVSGTTNDLHGVTYANDLYVAVGDAGTILTSSNGGAWSGQTIVASNYYKSVTYGADRWVAVGTRGTIVTSRNGRDWVASESGMTEDLNDVAYGNGQFLVVGDDVPPNGTVLTSTDGISWVNRSYATGKNLRGVTFANGFFLVVGNDGLILASPDGVAWQQRSSGVFGDGQNLRGVTYGDGHWIVVGNGGLILTSTNSLDWRRRAPRTVENLHGVRCVNGTFLTVGNRGTLLQSGRVLGSRLTVREYDPLVGFIFAVEAEMDRRYRIQASTDLVDWSDVLEFNNPQTTTLFLDEDGAFLPMRFYRVVSP